MKKFFSLKEALESTLSPNEQFRYRPISRPDEIRLVKILPGSRISPAKCELQSAILGPQTPKYVALSYCWGDARQKTWVSCNGQRLALTKDLLSAIRRIRRKDETVTLWIDQICINQEDIEERSSQVRLMRNIYKSAIKVLIWLGDKADDSGIAFDFIPRLSRAIGTDIGSTSKKEMRALQALLSRPWFGRMWILQELGVATSAILVCGDQRIPWQDISNLIDHLQSETFWLPLFGNSDYVSTLLANGPLKSLLSIRKEISDYGIICTLNSLWASRYFDATDPRDKIYGLITVCVCDGHFIQPGYSKDVLDVYRETALALLFPQDPQPDADSSLRYHRHPVMEILCKAERIDNKYALPSWVSDWRPLPYESLWQRISENGYNAAGTSRTRIALTVDPNKIALAARIGDAVHLVSSIAPMPGNTSLRLHTSTYRGWEKYFPLRVIQSHWINESSSMAASCLRYRDKASRDAAFGSTLIGNRAVEYGTAPGQQVEENIDYPLRYWHFRQFLFKLCPNGVVNTVGNPKLQSILYQHLIGHALFERDYLTTSQGRRFFTSLGGYMGIGPPGMRPSDSICVFLGGNVPWIVRQEGDEFTLVGECYVHGIMDGKFIQTAHLTVHDIVLK